jgi:hypothetical protein
MARVTEGTGGTEALTGISVCIPVFDDWASAYAVAERLDAVADDLGAPVRVLFVDDGSSEPAPARPLPALGRVVEVSTLRLRRNLGHQRAIAVGLAHLHETRLGDLVVVMDGDGEDAPADVKTLIDRCRALGDAKVVFAARRKRTEGVVFRLGYVTYKILHLLLTGRGINIGNFSVIPPTLLPRIMGVPELWNHYAAGVIHARIPVATVGIDRSKRIVGTSKMNLVALATHGMSAISVFGDVAGMRLLTATSGLALLSLTALSGVVVVRFTTDLAIPGWATSAAGLLCVIVLNLLMLSVVFVLFVLQSRNVAHFLPLRDYRFYVLTHDVLYAT